MIVKNITLVAFGKKLKIIRNSYQWKVFYLGNAGKKREAHDLFIPSSIKQDDVLTSVTDLLHESATVLNNLDLNPFKTGNRRIF